MNKENKFTVTTLGYSPMKHGGYLDNGFHFEYIEDKPAKLEICFEGFIEQGLSFEKVIDLARESLDECKLNYKNKRKFEE